MSHHVKVLLIASLFVMLLLPLQTSLAGNACKQYHTVATGENLYRISLRYSVSISSLQAWNGISNSNRIAIGQNLCVSISGGSYIVQRGDTLSAIARRYGVTVSALAQANNISNANRIYAGQSLLLP
jgi:LysM repeat protein